MCNLSDFPKSLKKEVKRKELNGYENYIVDK